MPRFFARWTACLLLAALALAPPGRAQEIRYLYDELNRLVGVVDPQGNAAEYIYDNLGNLLQIKRTDVPAGAALAITLVRPTKGSAGTSVQLFGTGFSPTPAQNHVAFHGTAATVTVASTTTLTVTVPLGATTGPLTVTVAPLTATAPEPFTVLLGLTLVPDQADVALGGTVGFHATLAGTPTTGVTWRVNGVVGGNTSLGTISTAGLYTAPATPPPVQPLTIEAALASDPSQIATATVRVVGQAGGLLAASPVTVGSATTQTAQPLSGPVTVGVAQAAGAQAFSAPLTVGLVQATGAQALAGPVTVAVTQAPGAQVLTGPVTVGMAPAQEAQALSAPLTVTGRPLISAVTPSSGAVGAAGLGVTLSGAHLQGASTVRFLRNGTLDSTLTASGIGAAGDGTSVSFSLTISGSAATGARVVQVVTPQGTSSNFDLGTNGFTVTP